MSEEIQVLNKGTASPPYKGIGIGKNHRDEEKACSEDKLLQDINKKGTASPPYKGTGIDKNHRNEEKACSEDRLLQDINRKIDFLTEQVVSVTSRLNAFDELKEDMALFANDAFSEIVNFLADVDFHFRSEDLMALIKKMLRNIKNISRLMTQLESITDLAEDVSPLVKEIFNDLVEKFEQLEKDGLFKSLESLMSGVKRLHANFTPEEIERMGDNHVRLLKFSNRLATPQNLEKLEHIAAEIEKIDFKKKEKVSLFRLFKKARNPEVLRSIDLVFDIAAIISRQNNNKNTINVNKEVT